MRDAAAERSSPNPRAPLLPLSRSRPDQISPILQRRVSANVGLSFFSPLSRLGATRGERQLPVGWTERVPRRFEGLKAYLSSIPRLEIKRPPPTSWERDVSQFSSEKRTRAPRRRGHDFWAAHTSHIRVRYLLVQPRRVSSALAAYPGPCRRCAGLCIGTRSVPHTLCEPLRLWPPPCDNV